MNPMSRELQLAGKEARREWVLKSDEMLRLHGHSLCDREDREKFAADLDRIHATHALAAEQGTGTVRWRLWLRERSDLSGVPVYPYVELRLLSDGYSVHLVKKRQR